MKHILLAIDGSHHAATALDVAVALAVRDGAAMHVLHVVTDHQPNEEARHAVEVEFADELVARSRSSLMPQESSDEAVLARLIVSRQGQVATIINTIMGENILARAERVLHERDVDKVTTRLASGDPAERILEYAAEDNCDAIVMGSRGHGRFNGTLMGSVSQAVSHRAGCTVVVVK